MYKGWMWKQRSFREQFQGDEASGSVGGAAVAEAVDGSPAVSEEGDSPDAEADGEPADPTGNDTGELVITLEGEESEDEEHARAPEWARELRKSYREKTKRIRELEQQIAASSAPQKVELGAKPTLESCEYDPDRFEADLTAWHERKRQIEQKAEAERKATEEAQAAWQRRVSGYNEAKAKLLVADFEDAEASVQSVLDTTKQAIILTGAEKPEQLIYAIGKSPAKLQELAAIKDPVQFAFAVARLETKLKVAPRKAPPPAEKVIAGSGGTKASVDSTLDKLREEALRTGDASKLFAHKMAKRK